MDVNTLVCLSSELGSGFLMGATVGNTFSLSLVSALSNSNRFCLSSLEFDLALVTLGPADSESEPQLSCAASGEVDAPLEIELPSRAAGSLSSGFAYGGGEVDLSTCHHELPRLYRQLCIGCRQEGTVRTNKLFAPVVLSKAPVCAL